MSNPRHLAIFSTAGTALAKLAPFLKHLYTMLQEEQNDPTILSWLSSQDGFVVLDKSRLCDEVLPAFVKTQNYNSFLRQVSFYQFRKISAAELTADDLPDALCARLHAKLVRQQQEGSKAGDSNSPAGQDVARLRQDLMATAEFRDMLTASDAFRHSSFLSQDPEALLRITRRVPQKRLQGANRTNSLGSARQSSSSSQPSHPASVATAAAAMASLSQAGAGPGGQTGQYSFPPHIPQYATAPHAVRLQSDPYMHSHPPGGDDGGGFTSFKYTRAGGNAGHSAPPAVGQPGAPHPGPGAASALNMPPNGWASEMRMHTGAGYAAVPAPPVPGSSGWHAPWQGNMWGGAPPSHRTSSWSPRSAAPRSSTNPEQPASLSPRSARDYIDWAPAASLPSGHIAPPTASASAPGRSGEPGRYQPGAVARSAFTAAGGGGASAGDRPNAFLASTRLGSGESSPRFLAQSELESHRSRSRSPRPMSRPGAHGPVGDPLPRHNALHVVQGATDAGTLAALPNISLQSGRSASPRAWIGGDNVHGGSAPPASRRSVSPRPAAHAQSSTGSKMEEMKLPKGGEFAADELPRGQAITL